MTIIREGDIIYHKSNKDLLFLLSQVDKYSKGIIYKCRRVNNDGNLVEVILGDDEVVKVEK